MHNAKPISTPFANYFKHSKEMCPKTQEDMDYMSKVPYASTVGSLIYAMVYTRPDIQLPLCVQYQALCSLIYAMVYTRPDIAHTVGVVSRYMNNPGKEHWMVVKWILIYFKGTTKQALCFGGSNISLLGYVDADMVGDKDNRRSNTRYVFTIGGIAFSRVSKIQSVVALSTIEVEYVATIEASKEMI